jgi:hypothetical protein
MKLADFRFQRWRERRATDWKFTLALWTLLVASASYLTAHKIQLWWWMTALSLLVLVLGHALLWVRNNWISNEMDIRTAFHFTDHAENIVLPNNTVPKPRLDPEQFKSCHKLRFPPRGSRTKLHAYGLEFLKAGFPLIQVSGTLFFASIVFLVLVFG